MKVKGSGIGLEYCSVVPVIWLSASINTSASNRRTGYWAKLAAASGLLLLGRHEN